MALRIASWNVNGIRSCIRSQCFQKAWEQIDADVLTLQEVRADSWQQVREQCPEQPPLSGAVIWNAAQKKGYSGTAVFSKRPLMDSTFGLSSYLDDIEGRVITADLGPLYVVTVYTPNAQHQLKRLDYRMHWDQRFAEYIHELKTHKPVVVTGDLNVAHREIDLANPKSNRNNPGFSDQERQGIDRLFQQGWIDSFRHFNQDPGHYTWWSQRAQSRARNIGWRIDYVIISEDLLPRLKAAKIHPQIMGSDHCPVSVDLDIEL